MIFWLVTDILKKYMCIHFSAPEFGLILWSVGVHVNARIRRMDSGTLSSDLNNNAKLWLCKGKMKQMSGTRKHVIKHGRCDKGRRGRKVRKIFSPRLLWPWMEPQIALRGVKLVWAQGVVHDEGPQGRTAEIGISSGYYIADGADRYDGCIMQTYNGGSRCRSGKCRDWNGCRNQATCIE